MDLNRSALFLGRKKEECITIAGTSYRMPPGSIMKYIYEIERNYRWIEEIYVAERLMKLSQTSAKCQTPEIKKNIIEAIQAIVKMKNNTLPKVLKELLLFLPAYSAYLDVERQHGLLRDGRRSVDGLILNSRAYQALNKDFNEELYIRLCLWKKVISYLEMDTISEEFLMKDIEEYDFSQMLIVLAEYGYNLRLIYLDLQKLKKWITAVFLQCNFRNTLGEIKDALQNTIQPTILITSENARSILKNADLRDNEHVFCITTLSAIVLLEMQLCVEHNLTFRKCAFCNEYFAASGKLVKYCKYPNLNYDNQICQKVAPRAVFYGGKWKKQYQNNRLTYQKWCNRISNKSSEKMKKIAKSFPDNEHNMRIKEINDEIASIFRQWEEQAVQALKDFENNKISESECAMMIKLPPVKERSLILSSWDGVEVGYYREKAEKKK